MTLYTLVSILKSVALSQPNIRMATDGSIYDVMNATNSVKYDVVHFSQTKHIEDEETDTYGFNIFYVSRLEDSLEDNRLQIQSIGKEVLGNILRSFCENWSIDFPEIIYYPYTQKFADLCAGVYCRVEIEVPKELLCADDYTAEVVPGSGIKLQDVTLTIKQNGLRVITPDAEYDGIGEVRIVTDVPQTAADLEYKEVEYTENGDYTITPDEGYDGLSEVAVSIDVPDHYDEGYTEGKQDGVDEQKAKLTVTSFTQNNTYTRADGWSAVTVNVPQGQGYEEGYEDGEAAQKAKLSAITITENGNYDRPDGYSGITVNVPQGQGYEQGYADGEAAQKAKLTTTSVTENGTYTREDGYSAITVNVDDRYDEGYADGFAAGASACSAFFISAITLNVDSAITDSATATTTFSPQTAITDIYYTSSDPSIATIDSGTGVITAVGNGTVTICTNDRWTGLQDCKTVFVVNSTACTTVGVVYYVTSTAQPTQILSTTGTAELNYFSKMTYNGVDYNISTGFTFPSTGMQRVEYTLASGRTRMGGRSFDNVATVREAYFSNCISYMILGEFEGSGLRKVQFNNGLQTIGIGSFYGSNLSAVTIPNSVTGIDGDAFNHCTNLTSLTIGTGCLSIGANAFRSCTSLSGITVMASTPPELVTTPASQSYPAGIYCFDDTNNCPIYVPAASVNDYKNSSYWSKYANRITAITT